MADNDALNALQTLIDNGVNLDVQDICEQLLAEDDDDRELALAALLGTAEVHSYHGGIYIGNGGEYLVLTDDEADEALDEYLEQLLDEPGMVDGADSPYFNRDAWKRDAAMDGRGHFLAGYDGNEEESGNFFIYRVG